MSKQAEDAPLRPAPALATGAHGANGSGIRAAGGQANELGVPFRRLLPRLAPFLPPDDGLIKLGEAMLERPGDPALAEDSRLPAGYTYLGQFIDHDITFDPRSLASVSGSGGQAPLNFRNPRLDLDSVYGLGPTLQPYLFQADGRKLRLGLTSPAGALGKLPNDLLRVVGDGTPIIGDPRNDENLLVAQIHALFVKFHNAVADAMPRSSFEEVRLEVVRHYQHVVLHDFLARILELDTLRRLVQDGLKHYEVGSGPYIPLEFSVAAFRFGHSMVREDYSHNRIFPKASLATLFNFTGRGGGANPLPSNWIVDWRRFFEVGDPLPAVVTRNFARPIDARLTEALHLLTPPDVSVKLSVRNLLRGKRAGLPSAQAVIGALGLDPSMQPSSTELGTGPDGAVATTEGFVHRSPLWWYVLKEAEIQMSGERLGLLGSAIVGETFVGLLREDRDSILNAPSWAPTHGAAAGLFTMGHLINFVNDINPNG